MGQRCRTNRYGFPIRHLSRQKAHFGFQTGDLVQAVIPRGKYAGAYIGRVLVRATGRFDIITDGHKVAQGISYQYCRILQRGDGWQYTKRPVSA